MDQKVALELPINLNVNLKRVLVNLLIVGKDGKQHAAHVRMGVLIQLLTNYVFVNVQIPQELPVLFVVA